MDYAADGLKPCQSVSSLPCSRLPVCLPANDIPFSHRCLLRLPSFPFCKASRLLKLSRRSGSRRRNDTVGTFCDVSVARAPDCVTNRTRDTDACSVACAGTGSSNGIVNGTAAPCRAADRADRLRDGLASPSLPGTDSVSVRSSNDAVAWSVHAEIAWVCCGVRCPWLGEEACSSGWMAIVA